jgi:hypothetical protein
MAETRARSADDEVVVQRPEDLRVTIPVFHTTSNAPGSAAAFLLRRIAYRAGAYAPGIQEYIFFPLSNQQTMGGSIDAVQRWFGGHVGDLQELGYRLNARRVAEPTDVVLDWVKAGKGFRGALLPTTYSKIHPTEREPDFNHAVAITLDRLDPKKDEELIMVDPWPGTTNGATDRGSVASCGPALESAHRDHRYNSIIFYWTGWS